MYAADSEMVLEGFNHPSIYAWSMFNEPTDPDIGSDIDKENTIIHNLDPVAGSGRVTLVANIQGLATKFIYDVYGLNYDESTSSSAYCINTEAYGNASKDCNLYGNWVHNYIRGSAMDEDLSSNCSEAILEDSVMRSHYFVNFAGAHFWCFMDYTSGSNTVGHQGIVDRIWLPKNVYFRMRKSLTGAVPDYWTKGTPTKLELTSDNTNLNADGSDISLITATLRDANNACVHKDCNVTFTATPASCVRLLYGGDSISVTDSGNPVTVPIEGGRAGVLLRTSRNAGTITVSARATCVSTTPSVVLTSTAPDAEKIGPLLWSISPARHESAKALGAMIHLKVTNTPNGVRLSFPSEINQTVHIIDYQGKKRASYVLAKGASVLVDRKSVGSGIVYAVWDNNGLCTLTRLNIVH